MTGRQAGPQAWPRFRPELPDRKVVGDWVVVRERVRAHAAVQGARRRERDAEQLGLEDVEQQDLRRSTGGRRAASTSCRTSARRSARRRIRRVLSWLPMRGLGQGSRNDLEDFEEQGFIKRVDGDRVEFDYRGIHQSLVETVTPADVVWTAELLARLSRRAVERRLPGRRLSRRSSGAATSPRSRARSREGLADQAGSDPDVRIEALAVHVTRHHCRRRAAASASAARGRSSS